ncbi:MAG: hypothetical protein LBC89_01220 [Bacteroidales bacterium]|nr:hypothetical protein [Bacteroidales bacterium]
MWIAVDRIGKKFINFVIGDRGNKTAKKFWESIEHHNMEIIASDFWKPYELYYSAGETYSVKSGNIYRRGI